MSTTLQIVDADDLATVLWDFNDSTGAANTGTVQTAFGVGGSFQLAAPETEFSELPTDNAPGGITTSTRQPLRTSSWRLRMTASSYDNLVSGVGTLARLLQDGGVIKYVPHGSSNTRYIDFEPSPAPALFAGQEMELFQVLRQFDSPEGVAIQIRRQPFLRGPRLDSATNYQPNCHLILDSDGGGVPDGYAWASSTDITADAINAATRAYSFTIATGSTRQFRRSSVTEVAAVEADVWTGSLYIRSTVAGAKGQVLVKFFDSGSNLLSTDTGTLTATTTAWQRISKTSSAAPATTAYVRMELQMDNDDATSYTVRTRDWQLEEASSASLFVSNSLAVSNDPGLTAGRVFPFVIQGDAPAPVEMTYTAESSSTLTRITTATKGENGRDGRYSLTDYINTSKVYQLESATTGTDASASSTYDATASGDGSDETLKVTFATPGMTLRGSANLSTVMASRRGTWDVYVRTRMTSAKILRLQLKWGLSTATPAPNTCPEITHDLSDPAVTTFGFADLYLGRIVVTEDTLQTLSALRVELWAAINTAADTHFDFLTFAPAGVRDQQAVLSVLGAGREVWLGKDLTNGGSITYPGSLANGTVNGDVMELTPAATNEAAQTPPAAGAAWTASARHRVTYNLREKPAGTQFTYTENVAKVSASSYKVQSGTITSKRSARTVQHQYTFDSDGSGQYGANVTMTSTTDKGQTLSILSIAHDVIPYCGSSESMRTDPERYLAQKLDSSGNVTGDIAVAGAPPVRATPGLNVQYMHFGDIQNQFYDTDDSILARDVTVSYRYYPRYWG